MTKQHDTERHIVIIGGENNLTYVCVHRWREDKIRYTSPPYYATQASLDRLRQVLSLDMTGCPHFVHAQLFTKHIALQVWVRKRINPSPSR